MSELRINNITDTAGSSGPIIAGVSTVTSTSHMVMPSGSSEFRRQDGGGRGRGIFGSGNTPSDTRNIDVIEIATLGNGVDFGDDSVDGRGEGNASFASSTRGIFAGGYSTGDGNVSNIAYLTIASSGGVNDFGDLTSARRSNAGASNNTRGFSFGGSEPTTVNTIEFITIATTGDASDFGDLPESVFNTGSGISNSTRAIQHAGYNPSPGSSSVKIHTITISTLGDATQFGELTVSKRNAHAGSSNSTRGIIFCGQSPSSNLNSIEFITIATEGNAQDFGDASSQKDYLGACASSTRAVCGGGQTPTKLNVMEFVTISTTGDTTDFGDLTNTRRFCQGLSDVHGGLGD